MAGRKRLNKKKDSRGGARPGAGRPKKKNPVNSKKISLTLKLPGDFLEGSEAFEKMAQKHGFSIDQFILAIVYADKDILPGVKSFPLSLRAQIAMQLKNFTKVSHQKIEIDDKRQKPFNLPPLKEDPALKIVDGGKKQKEGKDGAD
ncbi:MAG: hypothetical protein JSV31_10010 [Desulfobacterales bacterium]|nr:MAG: hypothetical protein JSV31_10010 [Desulfobacterales bacterium]